MLACSILVGPDASVMTSWLWNLLNVGCSLVGYYLAAFMIDWKWYGRKRMQVRLSMAAKTKKPITPLGVYIACGEPVGDSLA